MSALRGWTQKFMQKYVVFRSMQYLNIISFEGPSINFLSEFAFSWSVWGNVDHTLFVWIVGDTIITLRFRVKWPVDRDHLARSFAIINRVLAWFDLRSGDLSFGKFNIILRFLLLLFCINLNISGFCGSFGGSFGFFSSNIYKLFWLWHRGTHKGCNSKS